MPQPTRLLRRPVLLIVGCGDIGLRVLRLAQPRWRVLALSSSPERLALLRQAGAQPLLGNLDDAASLRRLAGVADAVLHLAPPPSQGHRDGRTRRLIDSLRRALRPGGRLVYASTSGVYGDCGGAWLDETRSTRPHTDRARRRVDAENQLRAFGAQSGWRCTLLRVPGIYASDRVGGNPRDRVARGSPVLRAEDDVFTNHIHADDLARACMAALWHGKAQRVLHVCDDARHKMGDHFDAVADHCGLPRPPRLSRAEASRQLSPMQMSFLSESRQLDNRRMKRELRLQLRYPDTLSALRQGG